MKKISKYMLLLAAAVFTFTACEKNVEREPSPLAPFEAFAFASSGAAVELDPETNPPYEQAITVLRTTNIDKLDTLHLIIEADTVFHIDTAIIFQPGDKSVTTTFTFPYADVKETYNAKLSIPESQRNPYIDGYTEYQYKLSFVTWSDLLEGVFVDDKVIASLFNVADAMAWKVNYQVANLPDGNIRLRIINPFACLATDVDENGLYNGYPYNEAGDFDDTQDYNIVLLIDPKTKGVTFTAEKVDLGVDWGYGMMHIYNKGGVGVYVPGASITFDAADKGLRFGMGDGEYDDARNSGFRFYLTAQAYLDALPKPEPVEATVETYVGTFKLNATNGKTGEAAEERTITIVSGEDEQGQFYTVSGLTEDVPVAYGYFDEETKAFMLGYNDGLQVTVEDKTYDAVLYPRTSSAWNGYAEMKFVPQEDGTIALADDSEAIGFGVIYFNVDDESDQQLGEVLLNPTLTVVDDAAGAPAHKAVKRAKRNVKTLRHMVNVVR